MKKTILFCLVLAALLCGCQNRQELESSSQPESSASQEQQERTAMEQAVDQNLESVLASGVDQDLLEQLGVTLQSGQATLESGSLFTHEVALTSKAGSLQLEPEGLYLPDDSHVWEEVGTNMRVCALGIGAAGEDKLLAVTPWQVMILDPAAEDFAPVMLYETEVGGDTEILDAAPAENGGYGLLLWQEDRNLFLLVDDGGRELGRSEFPAGEHGTTFDRDERLISSNPCVFRPVGEAMVNLPGQTDTWLLENRLMLAAFCIGLSLQILVTEFPYFVAAFGTCRLSLSEWTRLILLAAAPLLAHELLLLAPGKTARRTSSTSAWKSPESAAEGR